MLAKVMRRSGVGSSDDRSALTARELDVLELLATGVSTEGIAESLHLSVNTVRNHISRILLKLGASTRLEAVAIGIRPHLDRKNVGSGKSVSVRVVLGGRR